VEFFLIFYIFVKNFCKKIMELETIIGLEIHAQLNTKTKLFCGCDNDAFGAKANSRVCPICMGFPGQLPVLNETALEKARIGAAALGCQLQKFSKFDRKNYFYPDLPTGYQISQLDEPISLNGQVDIEVDGQDIPIGITRVHLENDAGKLTHVSEGTLCDYNRAGTPLIEIVTEPDLRSPEQAQILAKEIQKIVRVAGASDADMEKGMMRFDASISLRPVGEKKLYPRTEIKNLNSFSSLLKALKHEQKKQRKLWEQDQAPQNDRTVGWLDEAEKTQILRDKESANDYRYFPEPDIPPVTITEEKIQEILKNLPELPFAKYKRYQKDWGLSAQDALKISEEKYLSDFFETAVEKSKNPKKIANLLLSTVLAEPDWHNSQITPEHLADTQKLQASGQISSSGAQTILKKAMETGKKAETLMEDLGLEQKSDMGEITQWVSDAIANNPSIAEEIRSGAKPKMIQFLMGQVMKASKGQANPPLVMTELRKQLGL
jgi:aspartyl-tRNA(Asn)/glutamyl-tRNA(Gln) amidotransferase subunit B